LGLSFFGLISDNISNIRINIFTQIHEIVFHGKGGYDWNTIYDMPRWLRLFTFSKIKEFYEQEQQAVESSSKGNNTTTLIDSSGNVNKDKIPKQAFTPKSPVKYK
jgi:hypothetical protein